LEVKTDSGCRLVVKDEDTAKRTKIAVIFINNCASDVDLADKLMLVFNEDIFGPGVACRNRFDHWTRRSIFFDKQDWRSRCAH
jgi:hypothetical protein